MYEFFSAEFWRNFVIPCKWILLFGRYSGGIPFSAEFYGIPWQIATEFRGQILTEFRRIRASTGHPKFAHRRANLFLSGVFHSKGLLKPFFEASYACVEHKHNFVSSLFTILVFRKIILFFGSNTFFFILYRK